MIRLLAALAALLFSASIAQAQIVSSSSSSSNTLGALGAGTAEIGKVNPGATSAGNPSGNATTPFATQLMVSDNTDLQRLLAPIILGDGVNGNNMLSVGGWGYNGASWDRLRADTTSGLWVNVKASVLPTGAALEAGNLATLVTGLGSPGATACATDTASCSTNQQLQRIAQRLTTLNTTLGTPFQAGGALAANQSVNTAQVNGVTTSTGTGAVGTGSQRVAVGTDTATVAGSSPTTAMVAMGVGATAAAPPANVNYLGANSSGATGGLLKGLITCDLHAKYDASDTGSITLVTGVSGRKVYICGYIMATGGTATNLKLREGSDANCATNGADLTPAYQLGTNDRIGMMSPFWTGLAVSTNAYYVCINASAANAHQAQIWYTIL